MASTRQGPADRLAIGTTPFSMLFMLGAPMWWIFGWHHCFPVLWWRGAFRSTGIVVKYTDTPTVYCTCFCQTVAHQVGSRPSTVVQLMNAVYQEDSELPGVPCSSQWRASRCSHSTGLCTSNHHLGLVQDVMDDQDYDDITAEVHAEADVKNGMRDLCRWLWIQPDTSGEIPSEDNHWALVFSNQIKVESIGSSYWVTNDTQYE